MGRNMGGFPCGSAGKESACSVGDLGSIPGLGRSPGEGKGYSLQYSGLANPTDSQRVGHDWELSLSLKIQIQLNIFHLSNPYCPICTINSVQSLSQVQLFLTSWAVARQAFLFITNSQSLLKLMSIDLVMPSNHLIPCHPLLLPPSIFPSIRVFSNESVFHIRWPKDWSFSFSTSPFHWIFRIDFL